MSSAVRGPLVERALPHRAFEIAGVITRDPG